LFFARLFLLLFSVNVLNWTVAYRLLKVVTQADVMDDVRLIYSVLICIFAVASMVRAFDITGNFCGPYGLNRENDVYVFIKPIALSYYSMLFFIAYISG